jgi:hypothetical protein
MFSRWHITVAAATCPANCWPRCRLSDAVFGHPDDEAVARVIAAPTGAAKTLYFNYTAATIAKNYKKKKKRKQPNWDIAQFRRKYDFTVKFPASDDDGMTLDV